MKHIIIYDRVYFNEIIRFLVLKNFVAKVFN